MSTDYARDLSNPCEGSFKFLTGIRHAIPETIDEYWETLLLVRNKRECLQDLTTRYPVYLTFDERVYTFWKPADVEEFIGQLTEACLAY